MRPSLLAGDPIDVKAGSPEIMFPASFFCPGRQPRFATCFPAKSKEGGVLVCRHSLVTLLVQPLLCLTVFFSGGNPHKLASSATTKFKAQNKFQITFPTNVHATRGAKTQHHSTPTNTKLTAQEEPPDLSKPDGLTIELSKTQEPIKWF